tara:strand:+ start:703 stop:1587 length:885 start_codon:yes stop_codon:yes gene_type:complete
MANFIYKKEEVKVYIVYNNLKYNIDISEIDFSQTFKENSYGVKTLHDQNYFEGSVINQANPATFSLNTPILKEATNKIIFDRLLDVAFFDLYISSKYDDFKLENCVITSGAFEIEGSRPLRLDIQGEASKLSRFTGTIPGVLQNTGITTSTYMLSRFSSLSIGTTNVSPSKATVELQNGIEWQRYTTVNGAVDATNAATSMYPSSVIIQKKVLAGSIELYLKEESSSMFTWNTDTSIRLKVGTTTGTFYGLDFNLTNCSFTNRIKSGDVFTEEYNWRMIQNPTTLSNVITYTTA